VGKLITTVLQEQEVQKIQVMEQQQTLGDLLRIVV
jgi:hypothetical protein